jgi:hypothetical protein
MRQKRLLAFAAACATITIGLSFPTHIVSGQAAFSTYNPYPPGILPADLDSEIAGVLR